MKKAADLIELKDRSNSAVARMESNVAALNALIDKLERDPSRIREFTLDAVKEAREDVIPILAAELDRIRGFWTEAAPQQRFWESAALIMSQQVFDADPAKDATIKMGLRAEYSAMPAPLLQLAFEDAHHDGNLPLVWVIFSTGRRMIESNAALAGAVTATLDGIEIPEQAGALAAISVCQANLGHAESIAAVAAGLRLDPIRKMQVGRQQQQSSRLVAAAAGVNPDA